MGASHTHRIRVAYGDCDPSGVVFNPNYLVFYDVALTEFWRAHAGGYGSLMEEGVDLLVVEASPPRSSVLVPPAIVSSTLS